MWVRGDSGRASISGCINSQSFIRDSLSALLPGACASPFSYSQLLQQQPPFTVLEPEAAREAAREAKGCLARGSGGGCVEGCWRRRVFRTRAVCTVLASEARLLPPPRLRTAAHNGGRRTGAAELPDCEKCSPIRNNPGAALPTTRTSIRHHHHCPTVAVTDAL